MGRYLARKILIYALTFFVAVTIDWAIPRFMPGDPIEGLLSRMQAQPSASEELTGYYTEAFGFDVPLWQQYLNFWAALFHGDLGLSIANFPDTGHRADHGRAPVHARPARAGGPAELLGGEQGRRPRGTPKAARQHVLPVGYVLTATPQMWLGIILAWLFASTLAIFPVSGAYGFALQPEWSLEFARLPTPLDPAVLGPLPRCLRRLGDRDEEPDHLRARGGLLELPGCARRADEARAQVRVSKRAAAPDHRTGSRARRCRRGRDRRRDRFLLPGSAP